MDYIISYLKENISWIKDIFTLILAAVATVIGILTYKRARATILQPIRTEVIKKQSFLLTELLDYLTSKKDQSFDYIGIVSINSILMLNDYGFIIKNNKEIVEQALKQVAGWLPCGNSPILKDVEIIDVFSDNNVKNNIMDNIQIGKQKYENAKRGIVEIDKIYLTKQYQESYNKISSYAYSPFLPTEIQEIITNIIKDVQINLTVNLKKVLENVLLDYCALYFNKKEIKNISPIGVYNNFNHIRLHHRPSFLILSKQVRNYLRIDEKW